MSSEQEVIQITQDSLDLVSEIFQLGSAFSDVSQIIKVSGALASSIPLLGAVLVLVGDLLPDSKHEEILRGFKELSNKIDQVRNDMKDLESMIKVEFTELQYADHVGVMELGMQYWFEMANASGMDDMKMHQSKLIDLCAHERCTLALKSILDGVNGNGFFKRSILDIFYNTAEGNRTKISSLGTRLLQLVYGGMMVISSYETMVRGEKAHEYVTKTFAKQLSEASGKVQSVLDKCVNNFREYMLKDLNTFLDTGKANKNLVIEISNFMRDKYDWLENYCLVYNDLQGSANHWFTGNRVDSLHRQGKCGIIFYRMKGEPPQFSNRYNEVNKIIDEHLCGQRFVCRRPIPFGESPSACAIANQCHELISAKVKARGIGLTACVVIRRLSDLSSHGTFSTKTVYVDEGKSTMILLLK